MNSFTTFKAAKTFVQKLKFKTVHDWLVYCKSGLKPNNIPAYPNIVYKSQWVSWFDFLGHTRQHKKFMPFAQARAHIHSLKLTTYRDWLDYCKSGNKPDTIPSSPNKIYAKYWITWMDWLNTKTIDYHKQKFMSFQQAKAFVKKLKLKSRSQWYTYCKSGKRPVIVPANPPQTYKDQWVSWSNWLSKYGNNTQK